MQPPDPFANFIVLIAREIFQGAFGSLIGTVFLRAAFAWLEKRHVRFGYAYVTVFGATLANILLGNILGFLVASATHSMTAVNFAALAFFPVNFIIFAAFIRTRHAVPFGRACLLSLITLALSLVIVGGILLIAIMFVK